MTAHAVGHVTGHRRGFALLMTLWLLVPVSLLLLLLTGSARSDEQVAANRRDAAVLRAAAEGGIETAVFALLADRSAPPPERVAIGAITVALTTTPLSGRVNPNLASAELLRALLVRAGLAPARADALAAAVVEWRTPGQRGRDGRSKAAQYAAAGLRYGPPGAPFETLGELRDVIGMPAGVLPVLRPALSLFTDRPPDPAFAPPLVRDALGDIGARTGTASGGGTGTVFRITAAASNGAGVTAVRAAVVRIAAGRRPWSVLAWGGSELAGE